MWLTCFISSILTTYLLFLARSLLAVCPALDQTLKGWLVLLERDLVRRLVQDRVRLDEHLARLLVLENHIAHLGAPVLQTDRTHLVGKESRALGDISRRLVDVQLLEEITDS